MTKKDSISIIIPVHNEEKNIAPLTARISLAIKKYKLKKVEVLFVDDGSTDNTFQEIQRAQRKYAPIKVIKFRKNFGKAAAYTAGFSHAKNNIIITMDGDMQDDPMEINLFLKKLSEGYDFVNGWKVTGKGTAEKTFMSRIFNRTVSKTFGIYLHDFNCPFKACRREVLDGLRIYSGLYRFIPVFAHNYGFKIAEIKISNHPRLTGKSKFGSKRIMTGFFDYLTAFFLAKYNQRPMHLFGLLALLSLLGGGLILSYLTYLSFHGEKVGSRPVFSLGVLLIILSLQFFSIGFIGEMFTQSIVKVEEKYLIDQIA